MRRHLLCSLSLIAACQGAPGKDGAPGVRGPQGPDGAAGATGPMGRGDPAEVSLVWPSTLYLGRRQEIVVEVRGWVPDPWLALGDGVAVEQVEPYGVRSLRATVVTAADAHPGPRAVSLRVGGAEVLAEGLLDVRSPIRTLIQGSQAQGGLNLTELIAEDERFFDPNPAAFEISAPGLLGVSPILLSETHAAYVALIAPKSPLGWIQVRARNFALWRPVEEFIGEPRALEILPATPVRITEETARAALSAPGGSWSFERALPPLVGMVELAPGGEAETQSIGYFFGPSGDFDDYLGAAIDPILIPVDQSAPSSVFGVLADRQLRGGGAMALTMRIREIPAVRVAEQAAAHALVAEGQPLSECVRGGALQPCLIAGQSSAPGELDTYTIDGLTDPSWLELSITSTAVVAIWVQPRGNVTAQPGLADFKNRLTGSGPQLTTRQTHLAQGAVEWGADRQFTVAVLALEGTAPYRLALRAR